MNTTDLLFHLATVPQVRYRASQSEPYAKADRAELQRKAMSGRFWQGIVAEYDLLTDTLYVG